VKTQLFYQVKTSEEELLSLPPEDVTKTIIREIVSDFDQKKQGLGSDQLNLGLRGEYLRNIDLRWQEHLENLEVLREAVYLRSYAQKNPLLEYKLEGFQIFDELLYKIRINVAQKLFLVKIETLRQPTALPRIQGQTQHSQVNLFGGGASASSSGPVAPRVQGRPMPGQTKVQPVTRDTPKVGRNDPCPCGSGKKYKNCHGR
jgi:preprotein translocase subunit SecA